MKYYSILEITTLPNGYLDKFSKIINISNDISEIMEKISEDNYAESDFIHYQLRKMGHRSELIYYDDRIVGLLPVDGKTRFEKLKKYVQLVKPDVIFLSDCYMFTKKEIEHLRHYDRNRKAKIVGFHYADFRRELLKLAKCFDQIYTGDKYYAEFYRNQGLNAYMLRHAFEPRLLDQIDINKINNRVVFIGNISTSGMHKKRFELIYELLRRGVAIDVFGNVKNDSYNCLNRAIKKMMKNKDDCLEKYEELCKVVKPGVYGNEYYKTLASYSICLNIDAEDELGTAGNMRLFEATGVGTCLLNEANRRGLSDLFNLESEVVTYNDLDDMVDKIDYLLNSKDVADRIARAGQKRTLEKYTYKYKAEQLLDYIQLMD